MNSAHGHTRQRLAHMRGVGLVNLATLTWATNMVLGRWLRDDIGPLTLAAARYTIASLFLAVLLQRRPPEDRRLGQDRWLLLGMALSGVAIFTPTLYLGLRLTTAVDATLINGLGPLLTGVLAALLIREPMSSRQVVGAVVGLAGIVVLIPAGSLSAWRAVPGNVGNLVVLAAVALWGLYSVLAHVGMRRRSALSATAFSAFLGLPFLLLAAAWELRTVPVDLSPTRLLAVLYIGIAPTVVGFLSWNAGVRRLGPSGAMVFYNTLPLYGALIAHLFLGESIGLRHLLGGALIVGGGWWAAQRAVAGARA
jgi:drug/metabolite transporter (DMT)-like permease